MANNFAVKDAAAASTTIKTTDTAGVHVPHHNVDVIAAGDNNIGNVDVASLPALAAGTAAIGSTKDNGPAWTSVYTYTTSADMTTAAAMTAAPTGGQKIVVTDILVSSDTTMLFEFEEETSATVVGAVRLSANSPVQITPRSGWKLPTADKKLFGDAGAAGNVYVTVWYYSEA
jgi:hypothetical protein